MIKHIVMWKLSEKAEGNDKLANKKLIKEKLLGLKQFIPQIESIEVGENVNPSDAAFDMVLITTHKDTEGLEAYMRHPTHQDAVSFITKVVEERKVVDFQY